MTGFLRRGRPAVLVGAGMAILIAGAAAGAAGDPVIAGANNSSGAAQTILATTAFGASFTLKNTTNGQTGQFGWSSGATGAGRGLYGRADSPDGFGVDAYNSGTASGAGAALRARADKNNAIEATASGCTGFLLCGSSGVVGQGYFLGAGVLGKGTNAFVGVEGIAGESGWAFYGTSDIADVPAALISSSAGGGIEGDAVGATDGLSCTFWGCAGVVGTGINGTFGVSETFLGFGLYGKNDSGFALYADGFAYVDGDLSVNGTCTGCTAAVVAVNGGKGTIHQGDAVTLKGVSTAPNGSVVIVVDLAKGKDAVFGIADVGLAPAPDKVSVPASSKTFHTKYGDITRKSAAHTMKSQVPGQLLKQGTTAAAGGYLRVVTGGVMTFKGAAPAASVGDSLAVGTSAGKLNKAGADVAKGATAGKFLGSLKDGRIVLLVAPN